MCWYVIKDFLGTIVAYEVGVFGEEIGKFQGVEV